MFLAHPGGVSHNFNGRGKKRIDDILTRQSDRKLVRNAAFAAAIMRTAELELPPQEQRKPGQDWSGGAQTEPELQAATDAMYAASQRLIINIRDSQLRRAVRKACNWLKRVRSAAVVRFFERRVVEWEK